MTSAREEMLERIRSAIGATPAAVTAPRAYRFDSGRQPGSPELVELFVVRLQDYKARVHRASLADVEKRLSTIVADDATAVVPAQLRESWLAAVERSVGKVHIDGRPKHLSAAELDDVAVVVTACRVAIAETGTIVLDAAPDQGRRAITLVPDHHVVVMFAEQIVGTVPEAISRLDPNLPLTFVSGPSATSDIEFNRVEGVHGPRRLDVIVVDGATT